MTAASDSDKTPVDPNVHVVVLVAIEFIKLGYSDEDAAQRAWAVLRECEKAKTAIPHAKDLIRRPVRPVHLSDGPIPLDFSSLGKDNIPWKKALLAITGKIVRAEHEFALWLQERGLPYYSGDKLSFPKAVLSPKIEPRLCLKTLRVPLNDDELKETLATLQTLGVPPDTVKTWKEEFQAWWKEKKSKTRSNAAKKAKHPKNPEPVPVSVDQLKASLKPTKTSRSEQITEALKTAFNGEEEKAAQRDNKKAKHSNIRSVIREKFKLNLRDPWLVGDPYYKIFNALSHNPSVKWSEH